VIADDHAVVRRGLRQLLEAEGDFEIVAEAGDIEGARRYVRGHHPDVLVLDLNMPEGSSLDAVPDIRSEAPNTRIVVLTMQKGLDDVYAAGDMTAFPVKQGGLAAQQADGIANTIARGLGLPVRELDHRLVLQAHLVGGSVPLFLRTELDWQGRPAAGATHVERAAELSSTKVLGRYLTPYLEQLDAPAA
jgi:CheY-like chemotaxis protein